MRRADNRADCLELLEPQPPEPQGPVQACSGKAFIFYNKFGQLSAVVLNQMCVVIVLYKWYPDR